MPESLRSVPGSVDYACFGSLSHRYNRPRRRSGVPDFFGRRRTAHAVGYCYGALSGCAWAETEVAGARLRKAATAQGQAPQEGNNASP